MKKDKNNSNSVFARNLQECLRVKDWDQQTFAKYMGVSVSSVSQWIRGVKMPRMPKIDKMCQLFNCSRSDLLEEHSPDDERGELYAALLQQASSMTPEDIIAEIARMKWILSSYNKEGG
jgi:transcriptional regulator with XRE-family HTH domain